MCHCGRVQHPFEVFHQNNNLHNLCRKYYLKLQRIEPPPQRHLFQTQYMECHGLSEHECTLTKVVDWWGKKFRIKNKFTVMIDNMCTGTQHRLSGSQHAVDTEFETYEKATNEMNVNHQATKTVNQQRDQVIES